MLKYTQMFAVLTLIFFGLAILKFPVRIIFPKTKLYIFFFKAHKPFAIVSWLCLTVHGVLALINYTFSITGALLYVFLSALVALGAYKTYFNKKLAYKVFRFHRIIALVVVALIILHFLQVRGVIDCVTTNSGADNTETEETTLKIFSIQELSQYDGKEGRKAYIAVNGDVYDVTEIKQWTGGEHNGFEAGVDVTKALDDDAPHGIGQLKGAKIVGKME